MFHLHRTVILSALAVAAALPAPARAAFITSLHSGDWTDPATWDLGRAPAGNDQVNITAGATVTVSTAVNPGFSLRVITGGTLVVATAGQVSVCSLCQLDNGGSIQVDGSLTLGDSGTASFDTGGSLLVGSTGTLQIASGIVLTESYGTITNNGYVVNDGSIQIKANGLTTLYNNGTLDSHGTITNSDILENTGTINLLGSATLDNKYRLTSTGNARITIAPGALLRTSELFMASDATVVVNHGTFLMLGGGAIVNAGTVFQHYGSILGTAALLVDGTFNRYCGATIASGSVLGPVTNICADTVFADDFE